MLGQDSLEPPYKRSRKADGGQIVSCQFVVACCNTPEVLQPIEGAFDAPTKLVEALVKVERLFPVAAIGNDRLGSPLIQLLAQLGAIIGFVAEQTFR